MKRKRDIANAANRHLRTAHGITYRPIVAIVAEMAMDKSLRYEEALEEWATAEALESPYGCWPASRWHSEICYRLLKADARVEGGAAAWMEARAKEVRAIADRICP